MPLSFYLPEYLGFALASAPVQAQIFSTENGISRDALNFGQIGSLLLPVPPLNEQEAIAQSIEAETANMGSLNGKTQETIARLREYRTALISAAVTGKIDVRGEVAAEAPARVANIHFRRAVLPSAPWE